MRMLIVGTLAFFGFLGWSLKDDIASNYATPLATADESTLILEQSSLATSQASVPMDSPDKLLEEPVVATVEAQFPVSEVAPSNPTADSVLPVELEEIVNLEVLGAQELDAIVEAFDPEQRDAVREALAELQALEFEG